MQIRPDDRALLERIAALANADAPRKPSRRKGGELAARQFRAAWIGELVDVAELFRIEVNVNTDPQGRRVARVHRYDDAGFNALLSHFHALEQRGFVEYANIAGSEWHPRLAELMRRLAVKADHLFRIGFMVRPSAAGWAEIGAADTSGEWITAEDAVDRRLVSGKGQLSKLADKHPLLRRPATDSDRLRLGRPKLMYVYNERELQRLA